VLLFLLLLALLENVGYMSRARVDGSVMATTGWGPRLRRNALVVRLRDPASWPPTFAGAARPDATHRHRAVDYDLGPLPVYTFAGQGLLFFRKRKCGCQRGRVETMFALPWAADRLPR